MSTDNTMTGAALSPEDLEEVRLYAGKFRILIIGRANAGKTTILQKVCKTNELPEVFDYAGYEVDQAGILDPSARRGMHDINHRLVFKSNPAFVFHDSRGFESGGVDELEAVKEFIAERAKHEELGDQLHAIWYCLPMDNSRPITRAEEIFFNEVGTGRVPVILIFTKFDGFVKSKFAEILDQVSDWSQAPAIALKEAIADFEKLQPSLAIYKYKYPPKKHVRLQDMDQPEASCQELIEQTSAALDNRALAQILIATQQNSAILSTAWAMGLCFDNITKYNQLDLLTSMEGSYVHSAKPNMLDSSFHPNQLFLAHREKASFSTLIVERLSVVASSLPSVKHQTLFLALSLAIVAEDSYPVFGSHSSFEESLEAYSTSFRVQSVLEAVRNLKWPSIAERVKARFSGHYPLDEDQLFKVVRTNVLTANN